MSTGNPYTLARTEPGFEHWRPHWYAREKCFKLVIRDHPRMDYDEAKKNEHAVKAPSLEIAVELVSRGLAIRMSDPAKPSCPPGVVQPYKLTRVPL